MWIKVNFHCHIATWVSNSDIFTQSFLSGRINENYTEIKIRKFRELSLLFTSGKAWSNEPEKFKPRYHFQRPEILSVILIIPKKLNILIL